MKKTKLFAMMSVILAMGLAACGGTKSSVEPAKSSSEPAPSSQTQPSSEPAPSTSAPTPSTSAPTPSTSAPTSSSSSSARPSSSSTPSSQPSSSSTPSSSSAPSTSAPDSSSSAPDSSSTAPVPAVNVSGLNIVKKENNVFLQINGSAENIVSADFLWALGLEHTGSASGGDSKEGFILGAAEFAAEDYALPATLNADGSFVFEYDLTGLQTFVAGSYFITAAVKDFGPVTIGNTKPDIELLDANYRFYFRNDISNKLTICADELPPLALTEASVVKEDGKIWAKIGGEVSSAAITQDVLDGYDTFIQFQSVENGWGNTRKNKADGGFYWKLEGTKAFLYADITFFQLNYNYNTHLNVKEGTQANCKMEVSIDEHYNIEKEDGVWVDYEVFSDLTASGSDQSKFWGNLGFRVRAGKDPSVHYHDYSTLVKENAGTDSYAPTKVYNCTGDCNTSVLRWQATDYDSSSTFVEKNSDNVRFNTGSSGSNGVENKNQTDFAGPHIIYKINVESEMAAAGLAFKIKNSAGSGGTAPVFSKISGDSANGYSKQGDEFVDTGKRYGLKVNGVEYFLGDDSYGDQSGVTDWFDWPVTFPLQAGVNTIDIFAYAGYRANMYEFQLTGFAAVTPAA